MKERANRINYLLWIKEVSEQSERILKCLNVSSSGMKVEGIPVSDKSHIKIKLGGTIYETAVKVARVEQDSFAINYIAPPDNLVRTLADLTS